MHRRFLGLAALFCLRATAQTPSSEPQPVSLKLEYATAFVHDYFGGTLTVTDDKTGNTGGVTIAFKNNNGTAFDEKVRFTLTAPPDQVQAVVFDSRVTFVSNAFPLSGNLSYVGPAGDHAFATLLPTGECGHNTATQGSGPYSCTIVFGFLEDRDGQTMMRLQFEVTTGYATVELYLYYSLGGGATKDSTTVPPDPYQPKQPTDSRFVVQTGAGLKTSCTKRSGGPLLITVPVDRVVQNKSDVLDDLSFRGFGQVVSTKATVRLAVFHGGVGGTGATPQDGFRLDRGKSTDFQPLTGATGTWTVNTFQVSTGNLIFGTRNQGSIPGNKPTPGMNQIEIVIGPQDSASPESWCTVIDWVELSFDALAPVIFIHGNGQGDDGMGGTFWSGNVLGDRTLPRYQMGYSNGALSVFDAAQVPYDSSISMFTNTTEEHGDLLGNLIPNTAAEFGARHVHLIAHSKGGLDTRDFMARTIPKNFGVLSFTTFSTPHQGSSGPDYQLDAVPGVILSSDDITHSTIADLSPPGPGTQSLRVSEVALFNQKNIPLMPREMTVDGETAPVKYTNVVGDANLDDSFSLAGNPTISFDETFGLPGQPSLAPDSVWASIVEQLYRILGTVASTRVELKAVYIEELMETVMVPVIKETPTTTFQLNDFCVTHASGSYLGTVLGADVFKMKANHSTVTGPASARIALQAIYSTQPMK